MVIFGFLLLALAAVLALGAAFLTDGDNVEYVGLSITPVTMFVLGAACVAVAWAGVRLLRIGTRHAIQARRDHKKVEQLNERLAEAESRRDGNEDDAPPAPTA